MSPDRNVDLITLEVIRNKLDGISNEMQLTLVRSAFSTIVKEGLDASASMFTVRGETLSQALANPIHLSALIPMIGKLLAAVPLSEMKEGDVWTMNDPYLGGTHIPDIAIMMPVIVGGRVIAICAALTHHQDMGGMAPGSTPTNATEIFQEGLRLPLLKLRDGGVMNETVLSILRLNVRIPDIVVGDLLAEISACSIGARRLRELAEAYGVDEIAAVFDELLDRSERMTRQALAALPPGRYDYEDALDNDGVDLDRRIPIKVAVIIGDGEIAVHFEGTSPQVRGPFNCMPSGSLAAASFALRAVTDPNQGIPNNGGCLRPLRLVLPEASLLNPRSPAPVGCRTATIKRTTSCILGALRQAAPERVPADGANEEVILHFGGVRGDGSTYVTSQIVLGGSGASPRSDGVDLVETDVTNCMNIPTEAIELEAPIRVHRIGLVRNSGGDGTWRGGLGGEFLYEILEGEATITYRGERHFCLARGANDGEAGLCSAAEIRRTNGEVEVIASKAVARLLKGDQLYIRTSGGGGYGAPAGRAAAARQADIENGKVSA